LTGAASVELEPIWATLLAKALEGKNVKDLLSNVGAGGGAPASGGGPAAAAGGAAPEAAKEEEKKEEEKEESDDDMVRFSSNRYPCTALICLTGLRTLRLIWVELCSFRYPYCFMRHALFYHPHLHKNMINSTVWGERRLCDSLLVSQRTHVIHYQHLKYRLCKITLTCGSREVYPLWF
jgi:large subunit ribosomal protein LP1